MDGLYELGIWKLADVDEETNPGGEGQNVFGASKEEVERAMTDANILPPFKPFSPATPI